LKAAIFHRESEYKGWSLMGEVPTLWKLGSNEPLKEVSL
jgi:hypothetical protein